jgi:4-amino-4-deoxy-L-arabinose transferase-like glycosyltransferase
VSRDLPVIAKRLSSPSGVFVVALLAGLLTVLAMDLAYRQHLVAADSVEYVQLANNIVAGHGYTFENGTPGTRVPPAYPAVLAALTYLPFDLVVASGVANALFGAGMCVTLYWICRRTFSDPRVAVVAALALAVFPFHLFNTGYVLKENLAIACLVLAVAVWIEALHRQSVVWAVLAGVATGVATLTRYYPTAGLPIAFLAALAYERWRRPGFPWLRLAGGMLGVLVLCISPWMVRNWMHTGTLSISTYGIGYYLYTSNGPGVVPDTSGYFEARGLANDVTYSVSADQWNEGEAFSKAVDAIASDPGRDTVLLGAKLISFWRPVWDGSNAGTWIVLGGSYVLMMLLAFVGARSPGEGRFRAVLWATIGFYALVHLIFWGMIRERNYVEPFFMPFAARGLLLVYDRLPVRLRWMSTRAWPLGTSS